MKSKSSNDFRLNLGSKGSGKPLALPNYERNISFQEADAAKHKAETQPIFRMRCFAKVPRMTKSMKHQTHHSRIRKHMNVAEQQLFTILD